MIVILEGLERTGKSTVAKQFEEKGFINFKDHNHIRNMSPDHIAERLDSTLSFLIQADKNNLDVVLDRFHISEFIYSVYKRENDENRLRHIWFIDEVLSKLNTKLILLNRKIDDEYINSYPNAINNSFLAYLQDKFKYYFDKSYIHDKFECDDSREFNVDKFISSNKKYDFYLASPFFNDEQIIRQNKVKALLRSFGFKVYSPMEHGVVGSIASHDSVEQTFKSNVEAIDNSFKVIAITDGKDMGTIWEAGYAYGKKIPIVYFAETLGNNPFNIMLSESGIGIYKDIEDLREACIRNNFYNEEKEEVKHE